ncbi:UNVERIFIED_CONTAM: MaoC/PaaZ C-terminal domain-containing protein [Campylobacter lari]|nr:NAD-dependent epimerase/dehydratase family protein [Campylobacter lari]MCV3390482.1 NAD-dependent epimerase/dehydratase family protein [Campylobacter lari]MCV3401215.1 NAD-dependent epimerase/dehydratase family protein [Campylobacter lari]MCV3412352.1 NAD-dependent epimerase/dehydratase family protein [Campylobacter lari]MCV3438699.1 NAD-dependent epimerase/dehydratase family protein [Campylobacter lari]
MHKVSQKYLEIFSYTSGDFNPIHLDEDFAKNSYFNGQIVYGIYQLFLTIEFFFKKNCKNTIKIKTIKSNFINPLFKNQKFRIIKKYQKNNVLKYEIIDKNQIFSKIEFEIENETEIENIFLKHIKFKKNKPNNIKSLQNENCSEELNYNKELFKKLFPLCSMYLNSRNIAVLIASTRLIGMKIPGLDSIYSGLNLDFSECDTNNKLLFNFKKHHNIECYMINILSPCKGSIKAFIRPQLIKNTTYSSLKVKYPNLQKTNFFVNQKALIIGASSGFGNVCTKLLALGGATIIATYNSNYPREVIPNCTFIPLDVLNVDKNFIDTIKKFNPTHIYYFATPKISSQNSQFNKKILYNFMQYYIFALDKILKYINPTLIFTSSSSFVDDLPLDMKEYSMAKASMEVFIKYIEKTKNIQVIAPRFPRAKTNQTLNLIPQDLKEVDELLYPELLKIRS